MMRIVLELSETAGRIWKMRCISGFRLTMSSKWCWSSSFLRKALMWERSLKTSTPPSRLPDCVCRGAVLMEIGMDRPSAAWMWTSWCLKRSPDAMLLLSGQADLQMSVRKTDEHSFPMTSSLLYPVMVSAARLKEVMTPLWFTVKTPWSTTSNTSEK